MKFFSKFDNFIFTENEIRKAILKLKNCSSCRLDSCSPEFLKKFPKHCIPLAGLSNLSIRQNYVSDTKKIANIITLFKGKGFFLEIIKILLSYQSKFLVYRYCTEIFVKYRKFFLIKYF